MTLGYLTKTSATPYKLPSGALHKTNEQMLAICFDRIPSLSNSAVVINFASCSSLIPMPVISQSYRLPVSTRALGQEDGYPSSLLCIADSRPLLDCPSAHTELRIVICSIFMRFFACLWLTTLSLGACRTYSRLLVLIRNSYIRILGLENLGQGWFAIGWLALRWPCRVFQFCF